MSGAHDGAAAHPAGTEGAAVDPSMEDILASIRRILNEEETKPAVQDGAAVAPDKAAAVAAHGQHDVLELDEAMMIHDSEAAPEATPHAPPGALTEARLEMAEPTAVPVLPQPEPMPAPIVDPAPPMPPPSLPQLVVPFPQSSPLVAPEAAAAAALSVGALMRTLASERSTAVHRGGPTIEDLVRDEIRPLLKSWLDEHLPPMVERLVRAEIERVVSRTT